MPERVRQTALPTRIWVHPRAAKDIGDVVLRRLGKKVLKDREEIGSIPDGSWQAKVVDRDDQEYLLTVKVELINDDYTLIITKARRPRK